MHPKCYQTLNNGQRCPAPAMEGSIYCRQHHQQLQPKPAREKSADSEPLDMPSLPPLIDRPSILAAVNIVVQAMTEGRIKRSVAETLLSAIKFAKRIITEMNEHGETVRPMASYSQPRNVALAASARQHPQSSASTSGLDPETARMLKEIIAQGQEIARAQNGKS